MISLDTILLSLLALSLASYVIVSLFLTTEEYLDRFRERKEKQKKGIETTFEFMFPMLFCVGVFFFLLLTIVTIQLYHVL